MNCYECRSTVVYETYDICSATDDTILFVCHVVIKFYYYFNSVSSLIDDLSQIDL